MANHLSAEKRARQTVRRQRRNMVLKSSIKTGVKKVLAAVDEKDHEASQAALGEAVPAIARAAAKGVFHPRTASRKISRLTRKVNAIQKIAS